MTTETQFVRHRFTVDEYDRMGSAAVFGPEERLELINGDIFEMYPSSPRHSACVANLLKVLINRVGDRAVVWPRNPVTVGRLSKPNPDVALLRPRSYWDAHPGVDDVFLLIEVADASLAFDRGVKRELYARASIGEYWIVDTDAEIIETFSAPASGSYRDTRRIARDELVAPAAFPDVRISPAELFV